MLQTLEHLNRADIQGIKLQLLHILKGTDLARLLKPNHSMFRTWMNISVCLAAVSVRCGRISSSTV